MLRRGPVARRHPVVPLSGRAAPGSTTVVCSTSTRVSWPASVIVGRKLVARARAEVGETSIVLSPRNSSAWTMTA